MQTFNLGVRTPPIIVWVGLVVFAGSPKPAEAGGQMQIHIDYHLKQFAA